jgi:hypothetical protein
MRAQEHGSVESAASEASEHQPADALEHHTRFRGGAIPAVEMRASVGMTSASDVAYGAPGEAAEVTTARQMLLQVDPNYLGRAGWTGDPPDASRVIPIIRRIIEAATHHADDPVTAHALLALVSPYAHTWSAVGEAVRESERAVDRHAHKIEVNTGGSAIESGAVATPTPLKVDSGDPIDAALVSGSFLGVAISAHPVLLKRLRAAEQALETQLGVAGSELRAQLGVQASYSVLRTKKAYHAFALAIDINYSSNPYVGGQQDGGSGDREALAAIYHACLLTGRGQPVSPSDSSRRHQKPGSTAALWDHLHEADQALESYLMAHDKPEWVAKWIEGGNLQRALTPPPGVQVDDARLRAGDTDAWIAQIKQDRERTHGKAATQSNWWMTGAGQRTDLGFLDLDKRLVVALCDVGGLAWGGADFGETASGDMMHFDCRRDYSEAQLNAALAKLP